MNRSPHRHWLTLTMLMTLLMILGVAALLIMWIGGYIDNLITGRPAG